MSCLIGEENVWDEWINDQGKPWSCGHYYSIKSSIKYLFGFALIYHFEINGNSHYMLNTKKRTELRATKQILKQ